MSATSKGVFLSLGIGFMTIGGAVAQKAASPLNNGEMISGLVLVVIGVGLIFLREKLKEG
jgi:hypothetical protein